MWCHIALCTMSGNSKTVTIGGIVRCVGETGSACSSHSTGVKFEAQFASGIGLCGPFSEPSLGSEVAGQHAVHTQQGFSVKLSLQGTLDSVDQFLNLNRAG